MIYIINSFLQFFQHVSMMYIFQYNIKLHLFKTLLMCNSVLAHVSEMPAPEMSAFEYIRDHINYL